MKYYTPTLEEFYPGLEFQEFYAEGWHDRICWKEDFQNILSNDEDFDFTNYRVKYLDEQDIKDLGFKTVWIEDGVQSFTKEETVISWWIDSTHVRINYTTGWQLFDGHVKNVNELKKLIKQLGIVI